MKCYNCRSSNSSTERTLNGSTKCIDCGTILMIDGKLTNPACLQPSSKIGSITVDFKLGNTPEEFLNKLGTLLYESGVSRDVIESVEDLVKKEFIVGKGK